MKRKLADLCSFADGRVPVADLNLDTYISTENMLPNKGGIVRSSGLPAVPQTQAYQVDDVLVSNIRPYFRKIWIADREGGCSNDVLVFRAKGNCNSGFLYYLLSDDNFFDYATATAKGTKMPRGDKGAIMRYAVPDLPMEVQIGIADTLSALDAKIAVNNAVNRHLTAGGSAMDSSPDMRRGKRESRKAARRRFSSQFSRTRENNGSINTLNCSKSFLGGTTTHSDLRFA